MNLEVMRVNVLNWNRYLIDVSSWGNTVNLTKCINDDVIIFECKYDQIAMVCACLDLMKDSVTVNFFFLRLF